MTEKQLVQAKKKTAPNLKYMRDKDRAMVKGVFKFHECPGGILSFPFKAYKEDPVEKFELIDEHIYNLPLGVARHLNQNCWYPQYDYIAGEKDLVAGFGSNMSMKVTRKIHRCSFQSLEFLDIEDLQDSKQIETVEFAS